MKTAFSLVELSIVLVILGLLVGGVLTGQSLIRAAELRSVSTEIQRYNAAVYTFRDRFFALPGDMRNAEDFWGTATSCPDAAGGTCNGDGDGTIEATDEYFFFWQHLAEAGLIEGSYAGNNDSNNLLDGINLPRAKGASYFVRNSALYDAPARHTLHVASGFAGLTTSNVGRNAFTPEEAWNLDTKMDDGIAGTGAVIGGAGNGGSSTTCTGVSPFAGGVAGDYQLSETGTVCILYVHLR